MAWPRNKKNTRGNVRRPRLSVPGERPRRKETRVACNRLTVRDMRQIDPSFTATPAIWVREDALVVSLENVRAIILHDRMFVFDPENGSSRRSIWYTHKRMGNTLEDIFLPFEFRALEGILLHACMELERDFFAIEPQLIRTLGDLPRKITNEQLERLRLLEQRLNTYYSRARRVQQALQNVLDEDEDMADMYLTEKRKNPNACRNPIDHDEAEMLLETYLQNVDDLTNKAELLNRAIDDTENLMEIHLDTMQNKLLLIDLFITGLTTVFGFATMATAIFGMNFPFPDTFSELPRSQYYFASIVAVIFVIMALGLGIIVAWVKRQGIYSGKVTAKLGRKPDKPEHMAAAVKKSEDARRAAVELLSGQNGIRGNSIDGYVDAVSRRSSMERFVDAV